MTATYDQYICSQCQHEGTIEGLHRDCEVCGSEELEILEYDVVKEFEEKSNIGEEKCTE